MKASVYIATSLDGYIARRNGDIDWLHNPEYTLEGEDFGYSAFMDSVDVIVMGRNTFDKVLSFGGWHYSKPVYVLTSRELDLPDSLNSKVFRISGSPLKVMDELNSMGFSHIYVDGGITIQAFKKARLIDRFIITRIPKMLYEGIPLFDPSKPDWDLNIHSVKEFDNGFVQLTCHPI